MTMTMTTASVTVCMTVEQCQANQVNDQSHTANYQHEVRVMDLLFVTQSLQGFHKDSEAQCNQEDSIDKGTKNLSSGPAIGVLRGLPSGYLQQLKQTFTALW